MRNFLYHVGHCLRKRLQRAGPLDRAELRASIEETYRDRWRLTWAAIDSFSFGWLIVFWSCVWGWRVWRLVTWPLRR